MKRGIHTYALCSTLGLASACAGDDGSGDGMQPLTTASAPSASPSDSGQTPVNPVAPTGTDPSAPLPTGVGPTPTGPVVPTPGPSTTVPDQNPVGQGGAPSTPSTNGGAPVVPDPQTPSGGAPVTPTGGAGPVPTPTPSADCTITATTSLSDVIPTVGIVEFSTDAAGATGAHIDFGPDTNYGMVAPVDLAETNYRTLLLGMKASSEYHFRVVVETASGACTGADQTIETGNLVNGLPNIDVETTDAAALAGGFLLTGQYVQGAGASGSPAYILDADGDIVWWYNIGTDVTGARMSADGKYMWINSANVPANQGANVRRVTMDGSSEDNFDDAFEGQNHQLTVLPDDRVAFYAYGANDCDDIKIWSEAGGVQTIINSCDAHGGSPPGHCNAIEYSPDDDTLIFSDLQHNAYTKVTMTGEVVWVLGGSNGAANSFTGTGSTWNNQHGIDVLANDRVVFFNNGAQGSGSRVMEVALDLTAMTATLEWEYTAMPNINNQIMGDVQRLSNGNTIVAYSTQGRVHEVNAAKEVLQDLSWPIAGAFGYIVKRETLYGKGPR